MLTASLALFASAVIGVESPDAAYPKNYAYPITGNGSIVLSVDPEGDQIQKPPVPRIHVPEIVWEGRRYSRGGNRASLISMGHWNTRVSVDGVPVGRPVSWKQSLDRSCALVACETAYTNATVRTEVFTLADQNLVGIRKRVKARADAARAQVAFTFSFSVGDADAAPPRVVLAEPVAERGTVRLPYVAYGHRVYRGETRVYGGEGAAFARPRPAAVTLTRDVALADGEGVADFLIALADNYDEDVPGNIHRRATEVLSLGRKPTYEEMESIVAAQQQDEFPVEIRDRRLAALDLAARQGFDALLAANRAAWAKKDRGFYVKLGDRRLDDVWQTAIYNLRVFATKWSIPVGIFGRGKEWSGRYFGWDEAFTAMGAMAAGEREIGRLPTEFRRKILVPAVMRNSYYRWPTFNAYGARYVWETTEDGTEGTTDGLWVDHVFHASTVAECAWRNYLWSRDLAFLRETAYPVIRESALWLLTHHVYERDGRFTVGKCTDIERLGPAVENPFLTSCGAIRTFEIAAKAEELLKAGDGNAERFRRAAAGLRQTLPQRDGRYVPFAGCRENSIVTVCGYFPFPVISPQDPKGVAAVRHFADNICTAGNMVPQGRGVCSWYASWTGAALAAIGDGTAAWRTLALASDGTGCFAEPWEILELRSHPWFVSAGGNYMNTLASLLVGQDESSPDVRLAWGVPPTLKDYAFRLPLYGNGWVELAVKGGKVVTFAHDGKSAHRFVLPGTSPVSSWVDPSIGTAATGHAFPGPCRPFGLVRHQASGIPL